MADTTREHALEMIYIIEEKIDDMTKFGTNPFLIDEIQETLLRLRSVIKNGKF